MLNIIFVCVCVCVSWGFVVASMFLDLKSKIFSFILKLKDNMRPLG